MNHEHEPDVVATVMLESWMGPEFSKIHVLLCHWLVLYMKTLLHFSWNPIWIVLKSMHEHIVCCCLVALWTLTMPYQLCVVGTAITMTSMLITWNYARVYLVTNWYYLSQYHVDCMLIKFCLDMDEHIDAMLNLAAVLKHECCYVLLLGLLLNDNDDWMLCWLCVLVLLCITCLHWRALSLPCCFLGAVYGFVELMMSLNAVAMRNPNAAVVETLVLSINHDFMYALVWLMLLFVIMWCYYTVFGLLLNSTYHCYALSCCCWMMLVAVICCINIMCVLSCGVHVAVWVLLVNEHECIDLL